MNRRKAGKRDFKMKVYLINDGEWVLFNINKDSEEFKKRNIIIGDSAKIGNSVEIGDSAKIGYSAKIGNYAKIGDSVEIGNYAEIGDYQKISASPVPFTEQYVFMMLGILPDKNGNYTVYKSVNPDGTSFYTNIFKYREDMDWRDENLKQDQCADCGSGCHFSTYQYAVAFAENKKHIIIEAQVNIKDILSVHKKIRVKAFKNVRFLDIKF